MVFWFLHSFAREEGAPDWGEVVGTDRMFYTPSSDLAVVNAMPHDTVPEKAAKSDALIDLVLSNVDTEYVPYVGYLPEDLEVIVTNNARAASAAADVDDFITNVMGQSYPVLFPAP